MSLQIARVASFSILNVRFIIFYIGKIDGATVHQHLLKTQGNPYINYYATSLLVELGPKGKVYYRDPQECGNY